MGKIALVCTGEAQLSIQIYNSDGIPNRFYEQKDFTAQSIFGCIICCYTSVEYYWCYCFDCITQSTISNIVVLVLLLWFLFNRQIWKRCETNALTYDHFRPCIAPKRVATYRECRRHEKRKLRLCKSCKTKSESKTPLIIWILQHNLITKSTIFGDIIRFYNSVQHRKNRCFGDIILNFSGHSLHTQWVSKYAPFQVHSKLRPIVDTQSRRLKHSPSKKVESFRDQYESHNTIFEHLHVSREFTLVWVPIDNIARANEGKHTHQAETNR